MVYGTSRSTESQSGRIRQKEQPKSRPPEMYRFNAPQDAAEDFFCDSGWCGIVTEHKVTALKINIQQVGR